MLQMTSAYIHAEQHIIKNLADGIDLTGANEVVEEAQQVEFTYDAFGNFNKLNLRTMHSVMPRQLPLKIK